MNGIEIYIGDRKIYFDLDDFDEFLSNLENEVQERKSALIKKKLTKIAQEARPPEPIKAPASPSKL